MPRVYEEAARTLGATPMQSLRRVELPLLGPGISAGILVRSPFLCGGTARHDVVASSSAWTLWYYWPSPSTASSDAPTRQRNA